jgi:heme/copper-type cytochrome/quinol oxidase subunit 2
VTGSPESASGQPYVSAGPDHVWGPADSQAPAGRSRNGLGVTSLIVGILALVASLTVVGGLMLGVLAAILGVLARAQVRHGQASNGDVAMTGVVLGVLAIVASLIIALFWVVPSMRMTSAALTMTSSASVYSV